MSALREIKSFCTRRTDNNRVSASGSCVSTAKAMQCMQYVGDDGKSGATSLPIKKIVGFRDAVETLLSYRAASASEPNYT